MSPDRKHAARLAFSAAGGAFNLALLLGFAFAAMRLWGMSKAYVVAGGGLPSPTLDWAVQVASMPGLESRAFYLSLAWACLVAACGCAWMAVLGARWAFHAARRNLSL